MHWRYKVYIINKQYASLFDGVVLCRLVWMGASNFSILERSGKMNDQYMRVRALNVLACSAFALCVFASQPAMADGFANGSLQGNYAYVNNTEGLASFGPIIFNGNGGLTLQIVTNGKCPTPAPGCPRAIGGFDVSGNYEVKPDGTGVERSAFLNRLGRLRMTL